MSLEIMQAVVISSAHLTPSTRDWLDDNDEVPRFAGRYGWIIYVSSQGEPRQPVPETEEGYPADLAAALAFARSRGFDWLRFDADAEEVPDLPSYPEES